MFPLPGKTFATDSEALRVALEESLRRFVRPAGSIVMLEEKKYPELAALRLSLDGATLEERPRRRPAPSVGALEPALRVARFTISAQPILVHGAQIGLTCTARDVRFNQGRDAEGNLLLLLHDAADGKIEIAVALADLEALVLAGAKAGAGEHGVTVEQVQIELRTRAERALDIVVQVRAKKFFLSATVRISGSLTIDERLVARISGLTCEGEGSLGSLAGGFIAPHLARFEGREFSLMALPLGEVKLRDVRLAAGRELRVSAEFGRPA